MFELRDYQKEGLDTLERYLLLAGEHGAKRAFVMTTDRPYVAVRQLQKGEDDPGPPYVCLRVPTGGGKTLMAAHAVGITTKSLLRQDRAVCLWLVPSNTIREQTLKALRGRSHPYREALQSRFTGTVRVMDLGEAIASATRGMLDAETLVIVTTLQSLRRDDTEGLLVYRQNGRLMDVFDGRDYRVLEGLERYEGGNETAVIPSLANALHMYRPIVVMDEAHRARTPLSFDTLARFNPSCIVELTATPETNHDPASEIFASNILYHVSAAALKHAEMIKLPVEVRTRPNWKELLGDAIAKRKELEAMAAELSDEYLRPIMLLQAQSRREGRETLTPDIVKRSLLEDFQIPEEQVKIATGEVREIDDVDLAARDCPVRFIITVQALREGWDCPFAYVLCSVVETRSTRAVEQLLGRVLRMPGARKKARPELNRAYAFTASEHFMEAANAIKDAMVENGFERLEAEMLVRPAQQTALFGPGSLFHEARATVSAPPARDSLPVSLRDRVRYDSATGEVAVTGSMNSAEVQAFRASFSPADQAAAEQIVAVLAEATPARPSAVFPRQLRVPALSRRIDGQLQFFEASTHVEIDWSVGELDAHLTEEEFASSAEGGRVGELDVTDRGRVELSFVDRLQMQLALLTPETGWTIPKLCGWIDRQLLPHDDLTHLEAMLYIQRVIEHLIGSRGVVLDTVARDKFRLAQAIRAKLDTLRRAYRARGFTAILFPEQGRPDVEVAVEMCFELDEDLYAPAWFYDGAYRWQKHAFNTVGELKNEGEEFDCAAFIDQMTEVLCWIRNVPRRYGSFWLPTSTDRFYPDFVALLRDGRYLAIEYKNTDDWSNDDNREKRKIGALWQECSAGKCVFVMPKGQDWAAIHDAVRGKQGSA